MKVKGSRLKRILLELVSTVGLPREVATHSKRGFTFPVASWLRGSLRNTMQDLLTNEENKGLWNREYVGRLMDEHVSGKQNHYRLLWNLMVFAQWRRNYPKFAFREEG
jgi:asparagine synthase (glutamine-hydrolysing)